MSDTFQPIQSSGPSARSARAKREQRKRRMIGCQKRMQESVEMCVEFARRKCSRLSYEGRQQESEECDSFYCDFHECVHHIRGFFVYNPRDVNISGYSIDGDTCYTME